MTDRLQPAFWGGLFIGVLSALPLVNAGNCCCCLWVICGGLLAAYLRQQSSPLPIDAAEGALVGLMAGALFRCTRQARVITTVDGRATIGRSYTAKRIRQMNTPRVRPVTELQVDRAKSILIIAENAH